jgi:chemotaxis protein MotD
MSGIRRLAADAPADLAAGRAQRATAAPPKGDAFASVLDRVSKSATKAPPATPARAHRGWPRTPVAGDTIDSGKRAGRKTPATTDKADGVSPDRPPQPEAAQPNSDAVIAAPGTESPVLQPAIPPSVVPAVRDQPIRIAAEKIEADGGKPPAHASKPPVTTERDAVPVQAARPRMSAPVVKEERPASPEAGLAPRPTGAPAPPEAGESRASPARRVADRELPAPAAVKDAAATFRPIRALAAGMETHFVVAAQRSSVSPGVTATRPGRGRQDVGQGDLQDRSEVPQTADPAWREPHLATDVPEIAAALSREPQTSPKVALESYAGAVTGDAGRDATAMVASPGDLPDTPWVAFEPQVKPIGRSIADDLPGAPAAAASRLAERRDPRRVAGEAQAMTAALDAKGEPQVAPAVLDPRPGTAASTPPGLPPLELQRIAGAILENAADVLPPSAASAPARADAAATVQPTRILSLKLDPPEYGTLTLRIQLTGKALSVQLHSDREATVRLLSRDREQLSATLAAAGYDGKVSVVSVPRSDSGASATSDQFAAPAPHGGFGTAASQGGGSGEGSRPPAPRPPEQNSPPPDGRSRDQHEPNAQDRRSSGALYV